MIRALIVEDSPIVRKGIRLYLKEERDVEVVGESGDGPDAVAQIAAHRPDLVFLDIHMPGFDGFEVLERSKDARIRAVVFVTAHADYALRAFESNAVSYLLKPIIPARFREVVHRARLLLRREHEPDLGPGESRDPNATPVSPAAIMPAGLDSHSRLRRFLVKQGEGYLLLKCDEIDWISATGEYATLHARDSSFLVRMSLTDFADKLDGQQFARIHRSTIVNLDRVKAILPRSHGDCDVALTDGTSLRLSRHYRDNLLGRGT